jgi:hypothetical protein
MLWYSRRMKPLVLAIVVLLGGCASAVSPPAPVVTVPDLRGMWSGTWGGTPLTLLVTEQRSAHGESGLVIGPWQVLGQVYPTLDGVLTSSVRGEMVSTHMSGLVSDGGGGQLVVTVHARSSAGDQRMTLRWSAPDRLEGTGDSQYAWGPQGPVELARRVQPRAGVTSVSACSVRS